MQLVRERTEANMIHAWEHGRILVGSTWLHGNIIVSADAIVRDWRAAAPHGVSLADLAPAIALEPAIILLGTGSEARVPDVDLMAELAASAIGLETMTTPAACRTYNVLVHEGRRVVAALFTALPASAGRP